MFTADNCPYIVIGVPAYAPKSDASVGFALATRRVKSRSDSVFTVQDLTSALSRLESADVGNQLTFAIPADFELFTRPLTSNWAGNPTPNELLKLSQSQLTDPDREVLSLMLLRAGLDALLVWEWGQADEILKSSLKISRDERVRDEALNLLAACLVMQGDTERAIQALSKAVEGQWNLRLQANLAMLAIEEDPKRAIEQMSYLVDGASGAAEKLSAIKMAIGLWRQVQEEELGTDDDEEFDPLPDRLLQSIVATLMSADISEEDFFDLGLFVARVSPNAVTRDSLKKSPYKGRATAEVIFARSCEFSHYIDNVVKLSYNDRNRPQCVDDHVDGLVEEVCRGIFDEDTNLAWIAFSFLQQGLGVETMYRIWLRGALILLLPKILPEDDSPNEQFIGWLKEAKNQRSRLQLPKELMDTTTELLNDASDMLMRLQLRDFFSLAGDVENMAIQINQQMSGFWNRLATDKTELRNRAQAGVDWCNDQLKMFSDFDSLGLGDPKLRKEVAELRAATNEIRQSLMRFI
jgi:hypothetical protein